PEVALLIALRAVTSEIDVLPLAPVDLAIAFVVAPDRAEHAGPRFRDGEIAAADFHLVPFAVEEHRFNAWKRNGRRSGFRGGHAGQRRDHDAAGLRLPPRVDDGTAPAADVLLIPHPCLRIDWLSNRAEEP